MQPEMDCWSEETDVATDEHFNMESLLSRAAANWQAFHQYIPNGGGAVPGNSDLFVWDYIIDHAERTSGTSASTSHKETWWGMHTDGRWTATSTTEVIFPTATWPILPKSFRISLIFQTW
jgi:hypothetical protein